MKLRRPRERTIRAPAANVGIEVAYRNRLEALVDEMHGSLIWWIRAQWRKTPPRAAQDATPADRLQAAMSELARQWKRRFDGVAPRLADYFAQSNAERTDRSLQAILRDAGISVRFTLTPELRDVVDATTNANVQLIKSIPAEHLTQVQGVVMRGVQRGADLSTITAELENTYGITRRRAAFIARDQNRKANAAILQARQTELGIEEAIWKHSHGGHKPRPSHVEADGRRYKVAEGCLIDGVYIKPGELPNCRCTSKSVIPGL